MLNISDTAYEKFRLEAIHEMKSIREILMDRIFYKPFHIEVEEVFDKYMDSEFEKLIKEKSL